MTRTTRTSVLLCALCALVAGALIGPSTASAKRVNMKVTKACPQEGTKICGTFGGRPFGTCKMTGRLVIPKSVQTWRCKGGSFRVVATGTTGAANDARGTWKMSRGKGKFRGIRGSGTFSGKISTGIFTYKGRARY